jgi:putative hydrolase of the HAD superfamily
MVKGIFFDAGNTLVLFDCEYVSLVVAETGYHVAPTAIQEQERRIRFEIDISLLPRMARKETIHSGTASMHATALWQFFFSSLLRAIGVRENDLQSIMQRLIAKEKSNARGLWHREDPQLRPALAELRRRGYVLAVISNSDGRLKEKLRDIQLSDYFDVIIDSDEVGIEKPDKSLFHFGIQQCNLHPRESLYIGDLYTIDVLGARQAGIDALLYDPAGLYGEYETDVIQNWGVLLHRLPETVEQDRKMALMYSPANKESRW